MSFRIITSTDHEFGRFGSRVGKSSVRRRFITSHLSDYAFAPKSWKPNCVVAAPIDRQLSQGASCGIEIALA
jgi:hypothetical protein